LFALIDDMLLHSGDYVRDQVAKFYEICRKFDVLGHRFLRISGYRSEL